MDNYNQAMDEYMSSAAPTNAPETVLIKRYPNRKLYDTNESKYVTLEDIGALVKVGHDVTVVDNRTKKDLTALTLLQVMFDDQKKKINEGHANAPDVQVLTQAVRTM